MTETTEHQLIPAEQQLSILVMGNPADGLFFEGPFATDDEAITYAEGMDGEWWVAPLHRPPNHDEVST